MERFPSHGGAQSETVTDGAISIKGGLLILGVFTCCLVPLLLLGGGVVILSLLAQKEKWLALVTLFVLASAIYVIYLRRRRNVGDRHIGCD